MCVFLPLTGSDCYYKSLTRIIDSIPTEIDVHVSHVTEDSV